MCLLYKKKHDQSSNTVLNLPLHSVYIAPALALFYSEIVIWYCKACVWKVEEWQSMRKKIESRLPFFENNRTHLWNMLLLKDPRPITYARFCEGALTPSCFSSSSSPSQSPEVGPMIDLNGATKKIIVCRKPSASLNPVTLFLHLKVFLGWGVWGWWWEGRMGRKGW